jgi:hypothetical protein
MAHGKGRRPGSDGKPKGTKTPIRLLIWRCAPCDRNPVAWCSKADLAFKESFMHDDGTRKATALLSDYWKAQFLAVVPHASATIRSRLAWRLAAENIGSEQELERISAKTILSWPGAGQGCVDLRDIYIRRRRASATAGRTSNGHR